MKLFNKDKDLILKITNMVLILILNVTMIIFYTNVVDNIYTNRVYDYKEFKATNCYDDNEQNCEDNYADYLEVANNPNYYQTRNTLYSASSMLIAFTAIVLLNVERKNKE